jgi:hypothetical protein
MISIIRQEFKNFKFKVVLSSICILYFSWRGPCTTCCTNLTFKEELNDPLKISMRKNLTHAYLLAELADTIWLCKARLGPTWCSRSSWSLRPQSFLLQKTFWGRSDVRKTLLQPICWTESQSSWKLVCCITEWQEST